MSGTIYIYKDARGEYRWRLRDTNNEIIAVSGEGYYSEWGCDNAVKNVIATFRGGVTVIKL